VSVIAFVKRYGFGIIGIVIGILSLILSYYIYKKSIALPEPVFLYDPTRTILIDSDRFAEIPLRVVRPNGEAIKGDVTSIRFYFWNNGRKSIKPSNILEPLFITLDDPNGEILDYKILKCSRKIIKPIIKRYSVDPNKVLSLSFAILEHEDGLTGQILYKGNPEAKLVIDGAIEGVRNIVTNTELVRSFVSKRIVILGSILIMFWLIGCIYFIREHLRLNKLELKRNKKIEPNKYIPIVIIAIISVCFLLIGAFMIREQKQIANIEVTQKVPKDIIP
jgi:hypothetical protein